MTESTQQTAVRKPRVSEAAEIKALIDRASGKGGLLPRTIGEIYETLRDFHVYIDGQGVSGCCALHIDLEDLAEIRSLVVRPELRGQHIGQRLVNACIEEARQLEVARVYALTRVEGFFKSLGFHEIDKHGLPSKVFRDCVRCPSFPECDEIAVAMDLAKVKARHPAGASEEE